MSSYTKVLLINPPESGQGRSTAAPLGLMYIAAVLQKNNIQVRITDGCLNGWGVVEHDLREYAPDLVGVACPTYARVQAFRIARMAKEIVPQATTLLGGHHPTLMGRQVLEHYPYVDLICAGEGEYPTLELCRGTPLEKIAGLGFRKDGAVVLNPQAPDIANLDELPWPAWNLVDPLKYGTNCDFSVDGIDLCRETGANISFSRGCVGRCNFCSNYQMWKRWKHRSSENVVGEIEFLHRTYGIRFFQFNDDCFSVNKQAALDLCRMIGERGLKIYFSIVTRTDCVDEEILTALKKAGCYSICFGIETASPRLLKIMHKPIKIEQSCKAIQMVNAFGIRSVALVIAGSVGENWESINETIDFLNKARPAAIGVANGLMLFPGTGVYRTAKEKGFIDDAFWLTDYNWKVYTGENSRFQLNIFCAAIHSRKKLSRFFIVNCLMHHRFLSREIELAVKSFLLRIGVIREKTKEYKPRIVR